MAIYYVKNGGDDALDGLSDANAWETMNKINTSTFLPGDSILLARGSSWDCLKSANTETLVDQYALIVPSSGDETGYITFGAYGTGDKPIIYGSKNFNETGDWTETSEGSHKWSTTSGLLPRHDYWMGTFVLFGSEDPDNMGWFIGVDDVASLDTEKTYTYDTTEHTIIVYSEGNPATVYTNMYLSCQGKPFYSLVKNYIIVENIEVKYSHSGGFNIDGGHHIIIQDCDLHYYGGAWSPGTGSGPYRHGDGINLYLATPNLSMHDVIVRRCNVSQGFDAGISYQSFSGSYAQDAYNITFEDNTVDGCGLGMAIITFNPTEGYPGTFNTGYVRRNTITNSGYGWSGYVQNSVKGKSMVISSYYAYNSVENVIVEDNILDKFAYWGIVFVYAENLICRRNIIRNGTGDFQEVGAQFRDSAIFVWGAAGAPTNTGVINHNLIYNNICDGIGVYKHNPTGAEKLEINNNTLYGNGTDTFVFGETTYYYKSIFISYSTPVYLTNNIVYSTSAEATESQCLDAGYNTGSVYANIISDYNCFYKATGSIIKHTNTNYTMAQFATYQAAREQDANSLAEDPILSVGATVTKTGLRLQSSSPCIDTGTDLGYSSDFEGRTVPLGDGVDMGAYELGTISKTVTLPVSRHKFFSYFATDTDSMDEDFVPGKAFELQEIQLHLSTAHASAVAFVGYVSTASVSVYNYYLFSYAIEGSTDYIWQPSETFVLNYGDTMTFSMVMSATNTFGLQVKGWSITG